MSLDRDYLDFLIEVSEWFDWIKTKMLRETLPSLAEETAVLFAFMAVRYANDLEPKYYGRLPKQLREHLIRTRILDQYCEFCNWSG